MAGQLWGEIPEVKDGDWDKVVPKDIGKLIILNAIKPELPKAKQPLPEEDIKHTIQIIPPEYSAMEENVLRTVQLIHHSRKLDQHIQSLKNHEEPSADDLTELPIITELIKQEDKQKLKYPLRNMENEESAFTLGDTIMLPTLSMDVAKDVLYKSVAALVAHAGYDTGMESALQTLTDIAEDYFTRFTRFLRFAVDREEVSGNTGFPDVMERVFYDMRIGSMLELHKFYQTQVLHYQEVVKDECIEKLNEFNKLQKKATQHVKKSPDNQLIEEMEDEENIPEIHFPAMGDGDGVDELQPSLEPGFQMLHSLEQEVQMQSNMEQEEDEDVVVSDSSYGGDVAMTLPSGSEAWYTAMKSKKRKKK